MKRTFKKGEEIFAWNYLEPDLNGFGIVLKDVETKDDSDIVYIQVNSSGETEETADRIYKIADNLICPKCGCVLLHEHGDIRDDYPYYCPDCDENMFECESVEVDDRYFKMCLEDSIGRFMYVEE